MCALRGAPAPLDLEWTSHDAADLVVPLRYLVDDAAPAGAQPAGLEQASDNDQGAAHAEGEPKHEFSHDFPAFPTAPR